MKTLQHFFSDLMQLKTCFYTCYSILCQQISLQNVAHWAFKRKLRFCHFCIFKAASFLFFFFFNKFGQTPSSPSLPRLHKLQTLRSRRTSRSPPSSALLYHSLPPALPLFPSHSAAAPSAPQLSRSTALSHIETRTHTRTHIHTHAHRHTRGTETHAPRTHTPARTHKRSLLRYPVTAQRLFQRHTKCVLAGGWGGTAPGSQRALLAA